MNRERRVLELAEEEFLPQSQHFSAFAGVGGTYRDAYTALKKRGTSTANLNDLEALVATLNANASSRSSKRHKEGFYFAFGGLKDNQVPFMVFVGNKFEISWVNARKGWGKRSYALLR